MTFDKLIGFVERHDPFRWMLTFDGDGEVTLEYFPDEYAGDLEAGSGSWSWTGDVESVISEAEKMISDQLNN